MLFTCVPVFLSALRVAEWQLVMELFGSNTDYIFLSSVLPE